MKTKAKPTGAAVIIWRDLAEEGYTYADIHRRFPKFTVNQIRHYCLGNTGRKLPGPIQESGRWKGHNVWLQGEKSPHAGMTQAKALEVLADWDAAKGRWKHSASYWAKTLSVSPSAIQQLRRGDTWQHLDHPNQRRNREKREQKALEKAQQKARAAVKPPLKAPVRTPAKAPVRAPAKASARTPAKAPFRAPVRTPAKAAGKAPAKAPEKSAVRAPGRKPTRKLVRKRR